MGSTQAAPKEQRQALYTRLIADPQFVSLGLPEAWNEGLAAAYRDQAVSPADQQKIAILRGRADVDRIENERDYEINLRHGGHTDKRSEEQQPELQSNIRTSYAVYFLHNNTHTN